MLKREQIQTRRRILQQVKQQVRWLLGPQPVDVTRYEQAYTRELRGKWKESHKRELFESLLQSRVVYGSDFHSFGQAQRTHLRLLREIPVNQPVTLALECFEASAQKSIDRYLKGELTEPEFLKKARWDRWGFSWEQYRPLVELARERGFRIVGLNQLMKLLTAETLRRRDRFAAQIIENELAEMPLNIVYVIFGDLHMAASHLPREVKRLVRAPIKTTTVFQNSEQIYFELVRRKKELQVEVVKLSPDKFCVMSSPPWMKWQSYLLHLESTVDSGLAGDEEQIDFTESVHSVLRILEAELHLTLKLDDFSVYGPRTLGVEEKIRNLTDRSEWAHLKGLIESNRSFFLPHGGTFYLAVPTINHAADLSGQYLQARLSGRTNSCLRMPTDFLARVWIESLGFFTSKLVNHQRKAETVQEIQVRLMGSRKLTREALQLALDFSLNQFGNVSRLKLGRRPRLRRKPRHKTSYLEASRILAGILGERLYLAYRTGLVDRFDIVDFMTKDVMLSDFPEFYASVLKQIKPIPIVGRNQEERL